MNNVISVLIFEEEKAPPLLRTRQPQSANPLYQLPEYAGRRRKRRRTSRNKWKKEEVKKQRVSD